jgi:hypothetical protein
MKMSKNIYHYKMYGLNVSSSIRCGELLPGNKKVPDVIIRYGKVKDTLQNAIVSNEYLQTNSNEILLDIRDVAKYLIKNGKAIIVEKYMGANEEDVILFLLGSVM